MTHAESHDRRRAMLRTAMGPVIAAALADPAVIEVMVNPDGSLTFYCAIDSGVVLTVGQPLDRLSQLETLFDQIDSDVGGIDHVIAFDCVLNRIDAESRQLSGAVSQLYSRRGVVGFNTYGEQFRAAHINQTLSGLAIGR